MPDDMRKFVEQVLSEARAFDGCEATITISDPNTGDAMAINLFRDQAAMDAFQAFSQAKSAEAEKLSGGAIATARVYTQVIARL
jgi:hypothetical protein